MKRLLALAWLIVLLVPVSALAQAGGESTADYRFRLGPVGVSPTIEVENLGIDTNATMSPDDPVRDFTFRATPGAAYLLPIRRLKAAGATKVGYSYFRKTTFQRAVDLLHSGSLRFSGNRVEPRLFGEYGRQRTRPNLEIEAVVRQWTKSLGLGVDLKFSPRFMVQLEAKQGTQEFEDRLFLGAPLDVQLNRRTQTVRTMVKVGMTPITSLVVSAENARERFLLSPDRDAETQGIFSGFDMKPSALISGSVLVGYRRFNGLSTAIPDFRGLVADLALRYTLMDRTRFEVSGHRGVEFSAETEPYYVLTGGGLTITQALGHGLDIRLRADGNTLAYRSLIGAATLVAGSRVDHVDSVGGGFGYRVGDDGRIGFEISHGARRSPVKIRNYDGWRAGVKITYGS